MAHARSQAASPGAPADSGAPARSFARNLLTSLRPNQWTKNLIIFAALIFGHELFVLDALLRSIGAFAVFCALSGALYMINDVVDRESDSRHPAKSWGPIAAGAIPVRTALLTAVGIGAAAIVAAFWVRPLFALVAVAYAVLIVMYSGPLKRLVIIDVLTIAMGFVLRAVAGAVAVAVPIGHWLLICTILLALFLALAKRRHELVLLGEGAVGHRPILQEYSPYLLDQMIAVVTASTLMAYAFFTISPETVEKFGTDLLGLTLPFPLYGIFRYLYLVHRRDGGGSPSELLLNDRPLLLCVALWSAAVVLIVYRPLGL